MSEILRQFGRLVSASVIAHARLARAVERLLADEPLDEATRQEIRRSVEHSMTVLARELERIKPGEGDKFLKLYHGTSGARSDDDTPSNVGAEHDSPRGR